MHNWVILYIIKQEFLIFFFLVQWYIPITMETFLLPFLATNTSERHLSCLISVKLKKTPGVSHLNKDIFIITTDNTYRLV